MIGVGYHRKSAVQMVADSLAVGTGRKDAED